ncbi:uncharacterized protein LOC143853961 [Tasmannia lanceolata]|uniref:uncharacterized protein LOC143853961 n=1 Tax=Tasmannia lanceolata TaxID=3420 RepID=UPI004064A0BE
MYFDGVSNSRGIGIVLVSPRDEHIPISIKLEFSCTNNMAEYEACITGLEGALSLEVHDLDVYGDSLLIICQTNGKWLTKEDRLIPYHTYLTSSMKNFHNISFTYISRLRNRFANALATLASMVDIPVGVKVRPLAIKRHVIPAYVHMVQIAARCPNEKPWYFDIKNLISGRGHPPEASLKEKRALQKLTSRYVICGGDLYCRSFDRVQLLCVDEDRAAEILEDVHSGVCGPHMNGKILARKILRPGYSGLLSKQITSLLLRNATNVRFTANIICRYGVPHELVSDNGSHFKKEVATLHEEFRIKHRKSSSYRPKTNGAVCTSTGATPYSLMYGIEAVLPIELKIPSLRILMESNLPESEWGRISHQELCIMDGKMLKAAYHVQGYQRRVERAFNKMV